jgi:predicted N-acetyltransferase YhbS
MTGLPLTRTAIVRPERARDRARIDALLDACFGPDRFNKTAYRFREGVDPVPELSYVVEYQGDNPAAATADDVVATIRYWPLQLPDDSASLLLGPIAVDPRLQNEKIGANLMTFTLQQARAFGFASCVLVGDAPYYNRFGFLRENALTLELPGWVDLDRFLGLEWVEGSLKNQRGMLRKWPKNRLLPHYKKNMKDDGAR